MADQTLRHPRRVDRGGQVDVDADAAVPQQVHQVLGGDIAAGAGANWAAAQPPTEASNRVTPAVTAAYALASPEPRVLWKCAPSGSSLSAAAPAATRAVTRPGVAVPMVSAMASRSAPKPTAASTMASTRWGGVARRTGSPTRWR